MGLKNASSYIQSQADLPDMQPCNLKKIYGNFRTQFLMLESEILLFVCLLALVPAPKEGMRLEADRKQWEIRYWCIQHEIEEMCCNGIKGAVERHRCFFVCFCHFTPGDSEMRLFAFHLCLETLFSFQFCRKMFKWK